jgi:hypothetical protein
MMRLCGKSARLVAIILVPDNRYAWLQFGITALTTGVKPEDSDP